MRQSRSAVTQPAIIHAQKKIGACQARLDLKRPAELSHRVPNTVLQLINQTQVHVRFREFRRNSKNFVVFTLGGGVVVLALCLLGGTKMRVD